MRVLVTIPHFFDGDGDGRYGSTQPDPMPRLNALINCLRSLRTLYASPHELWYRDGDHLQPAPANQASLVEMDIVVCTCRDLHLLARLPMPPDTYTHRPMDCEPMQLGFECHTVLAEHLDAYDLFVYMEDDLILHDPAFFTKIRWFQEAMGFSYLLQPNRYENYLSQTTIKKVYIDFEFDREEAVASRPAEPIIVESFGQQVKLRSTSNAHAGCFFLSREQMAHWVGQPTFDNRDASYVGPLESAATLGLIRNFNVYKPAPAYAHFLEIEHAGQAWSRRLASVRFGPKPDSE